MASKEQVEHAAELLEHLEQKGWNPDAFVHQLEEWVEIEEFMTSEEDGEESELDANIPPYDTDDEQFLEESDFAN